MELKGTLVNLDNLGFLDQQDLLVQSDQVEIMDSRVLKEIREVQDQMAILVIQDSKGRKVNKEIEEMQAYQAIPVLRGLKAQWVNLDNQEITEIEASQDNPAIKGSQVPKDHQVKMGLLDHLEIKEIQASLDNQDKMVILVNPDLVVSLDKWVNLDFKVL